MDIINTSTRLSHSDLVRIISAINKAIPEFCKAWKIPPVVVSWKKKSSRTPCIVISDADQPPVYGFHTFLSGYPFGRMYVTSSDINLNSRILSHEVFEILANPEFNKNVDTYLVEVCDPVMLDVYEIDSIQISNWVYPSWFDKNGKRPYDKMDILTKPFETSKGGYSLKMNSGSRV